MKELSEGTILVCEECGERMVLDAPVSVWLSGGTSFACECGQRLTSAERLVDEAGSAANTVSQISPLYP